MVRKLVKKQFRSILIFKDSGREYKHLLSVALRNFIRFSKEYYTQR